MTFSIDNPGGGLQQPHFGEYNFFFLFTAFIYQFSTNWYYLYSSTLVANLIKKKNRPHTTFCVPRHEVNGHDVYFK